MQAEAALLDSNDVVAWFDRDRRASTNEVIVAIACDIGALASDVIVVLHFLEKFRVCFVYKHHVEIALARREVPYDDTKLAPTYGRRGLEHHILVHLDIHEDPSSDRVVSKPNDWRSNIVDGDKEARDRRVRISRLVRPERLDTDDEGDRDRGRRRDGSRGGDDWAANLRWSVSRAPLEDQRDSDHEDRNGRRGDRDSCDGWRRDLLPLPLLLCSRDQGPSVHPGAIRRLSSEAHTPPALPPLSPTSVLCTLPRSKRDEARAASAALLLPSPALIEFYSPETML
ncbi:hypothetical protein ZWY2020_040229 [Hordeum vulgare]|nr:hypothetical protein ZWY2020_040229 [Hordeum vulgare]